MANNHALTIKDDYLAQVLEGSKKLLFDGAMGTMLQSAGLSMGGQTDLLCKTNPDEITAIHRAYVDAGAQVITTNTFRTNLIAHDEATVRDIYSAAVACARNAGATYVAADIGPITEQLDPIGDIEIEEAYDLFAALAKAGADAGADLIIIETIPYAEEMRAAASAAIDNTSLPVFATMTFQETGYTYMGSSVDDAIQLARDLHIDAFGVNCTLSPAAMAPFVRQMAEALDCPIIAQANAGQPTLENGETHYPVDAQEYANQARELLDAGAHIIGGCCGTDPTYIAELEKLLA